MSFGLLFLRSCANHHSANTTSRIFRRLPSVFYTEPERPYASFAASYLSSFGHFPPTEAFTQAQLSLSTFPTDQVPDALAQQLKMRFAYDAVKTRHPILVNAMRVKDMEQTEIVLREMLSDVSRVQRGGTSVSLAECVNEVMTALRLARTSIGLQGASLGWPTLDAATNGLGGGELGFVVGRPGMGKSWVLLEIARQNYILGKPTLFVSMEMGLAQITRRWLALMTGINPNRIRSGMVSIHEEARLEAAKVSLEEGSPVQLISGDQCRDVAGLEAEIEDRSPEVILVDAMYLMRGPESAFGGVKQWEAVSGVVRGLKAAAIRWDVPIISSVQFNRNQKSNASKVMDLGDIAGADAIPQDASVVMGLQPFAPPYERERKRLEFLKHREGDSAAIGLAFNFDPVSITETPLDVEEEDNNTEQAQNWML